MQILGQIWMQFNTLDLGRWRAVALRCLSPKQMLVVANLQLNRPTNGLGDTDLKFYRCTWLGASNLHFTAEASRSADHIIEAPPKANVCG